MCFPSKERRKCERTLDRSGAYSIDDPRLCSKGEGSLAVAKLTTQRSFLWAALCRQCAVRARFATGPARARRDGIRVISKRYEVTRWCCFRFFIAWIRFLSASSRDAAELHEEGAEEDIG